MKILLTMNISLPQSQYDLKEYSFFGTPSLKFEAGILKVWSLDLQHLHPPELVRNENSGAQTVESRWGGGVQQSAPRTGTNV